MNFAKTARLRLLKRARVGNKSRVGLPGMHPTNLGGVRQDFPCRQFEKWNREKGFLFLPAHSRRTTALDKLESQFSFRLADRTTEIRLFRIFWRTCRSLLENNFPARESYATDIVSAMNSFDATILASHSWRIFGEFWEIPAVTRRRP